MRVTPTHEHALGPEGRRFRKERAVRLVLFGLLGAAAIAPIWVTRFLPLVDEPNHVSAIYVWHHLLDPRSPLHRFYELNIRPVSYFLHYFIAHEFAWVVGVEAGHKLALCLYVLGWPVAGFWWCRRTGRSPWLCTLLFALPYSHFWSFGFHPFNLGLVVFLFGVIAFDRLFQSPTLGRTLLASATAALCFLSHPIPLAMLGLALPVLLLSWPFRVRSLVAAPLALLPAALLTRWQAQQSGTTTVDWAKVSGGTLLELQPARWLARLQAFNAFCMDVVAGTLDTQLFQGLLTCGAVLFVAGALRTRRRYGAPEAGWLHRNRSLALALWLLAAYLVLPEGFAGQVGILYVSGRLAPAVPFFFLLAPHVTRADPRRWLALGGVPIALIAALNIGTKYQQFAQYMQPMPELLSKCKRKDDVLTLSMPPHSLPSVSNLAPFRLLPAWTQVVHGGFAPNAWERPIPFPFRVTHPPPTPSWWDPGPTPALLQGPYQCLLAHQLQTPLPPTWRLLGKRGPWAVYRRR